MALKWILCPAKINSHHFLGNAGGGTPCDNPHTQNWGVHLKYPYYICAGAANASGMWTEGAGLALKERRCLYFTYLIKFS